MSLLNFILAMVNALVAGVAYSSGSNTWLAPLLVMIVILVDGTIRAFKESK